MKKLFTFLFVITSFVTFSQELNKDWSFTSVKNGAGVELFSIDKTDLFSIDGDKFSYSLLDKDSLKASFKQSDAFLFLHKTEKRI
ncbi:hypothetical protein [Polaribacter marinivivus]|uniref:Uncharacterized protein n=1 Tax=Polaribacter marinivivus TaxID=1524260 RepID=A0ABV8R4L1_9FLAO